MYYSGKLYAHFLVWKCLTIIENSVLIEFCASPCRGINIFIYLYTLTLVLVIKCCHINLHMVGFVLVVYAQGSLAYCI